MIREGGGGLRFFYFLAGGPEKNFKHAFTKIYQIDKLGTFDLCSDAESL